MRNFSILFAILFICFSATHIFAQKKAKPREIIVIEFLAPNHKEVSRNEVWINKTPKSINEVGGGSVSDCGECTHEQIAAQPSEYIYKARAFRTGKGKANVGFEIEVDGECKTRRIFTVYRNHQTKLKLNCGVSITVYYGFQSEEGN